MSDEEKSRAVVLSMRPEIHPTQDGIRAPAPYVNYARVAIGQELFALYLFSVPPDITQLAETRAALMDEAGNLRSDIPDAVKLELPHAAKVVMPVRFVPELIAALERMHKAWVSINAGEHDGSTTEQ